MTDPVIIALSHPIDVIGESVTSLKINPPTGRHLMKAGPYVRIYHAADIDPDNSDAEGPGQSSIEIIPSGMGKLIAACANVPLRAIEDLAGVDFNACSAAVMGFLGGEKA
jgi:hypothetical protein